MKKLTSLKVVYILEIAVVMAIVFGFIPREAAIFLLGILIFYIIFHPLEDGTILFIASVPIFVALPLSENFDSLSSARVIILVLFLKWFFEKKEKIWLEIKSKSIKQLIKEYRLEFFASLLFLIMALSVFKAADAIAAIKKIIYFLNLGVVFLIVRETARHFHGFSRIIKSIFLSLALVLLIGFGQLVSVYFFTIGGFWNWWADHFSYGFYGENLRQIILNANTWFAASPNGPSVIRLFGSFTDSHSFALYLLLTLPFIISGLGSLFREGLGKESISWLELLKIKIKKNIRNSIFGWFGLLILIFFFIILSGTRGIWVTIVFAFAAGIYLILRKKDFNRCASFVLLTLFVFLSLIPIVSIFTTIPQFKEYGANQERDAALVLRRLVSVLDLNETSNKGRIFIWRESLKSVKENPWLGVGAGNFPVALDQDIAMAKAGSSAHNLYLNFAVENGILSIVFLGLIIYDILSIIFLNLKSGTNIKMKFLMAGFFIYFIWIFGYSLVDIALLDERVFLLFMTILALIYAVRDNPKLSFKYAG